MGGAVASWLVRSSFLCSWARHLTLTVPLSTQEYKWVPAKCWGNLTNCGGNDQGLASIPSSGSRNTPSRFMLQKPSSGSGTYDPVGSKSSLFYALKYSYVNLDCMNQYPMIYSTCFGFYKLTLTCLLGRYTSKPYKCRASSSFSTMRFLLPINLVFCVL